MTVNAYLTLKHLRAGQYDKTLIEFTDDLAMELIMALDKSAADGGQSHLSHATHDPLVATGQQSSAHKRSRFSDVSVLPHVGAAAPAVQRAGQPRACHFVSANPNRVRQGGRAAGADADDGHDADEPRILTPVRKRMRANDERYRDEEGKLREDVHHQRGTADVRFKCRICKKYKTHFYCATHSDLAAKVYTWVCISRNCHFIHAQGVLDDLL